MPFKLTMPKLSPTMEEGVIAKWHVSEGDRVESGDLLFEVSTDKATVEHNALDEGYLKKIVVKDGDAAEVGDTVAIFTESEDESIEGFGEEEKKEEVPEEKEEKEEKPKKEKASGPGMAQPSFVPLPPLEDYEFEFPTDTLETRIKASPLARKLAKEKNLDLTTIKGSGPGGRIMERDLEMAQPSAITSFAHREKPKIPPGTYEEVPMTPMRKTIGKRLQEAKTFIPHYYVNQRIDAENLVALREQLKAAGIKLTYNDFVIRACALALREHMDVNTGYNSENSSIVHFKTIDISVAVAIEDGLITPIIRHADYKTLGEISVEVKELTSRAKRGKLAPEEYQGGSFTVSNMGMYGIANFQAIINPPQSCILAIGGILDQPVVKDGQVVPGKTMDVTISADHRIVDGALSSEFLRTLKKILENPVMLIL
jgi:pyruvate dehydrogenase E2 component (dihydrolipoamide acetyltransferase)